jgi:pilus assembly protein FimV
MSKKTNKGGRVLKSSLNAIAISVGLVWSGCVSALGMGGINVTSSLGQPLRAEIELVAVDKAEKSNLTAKLASPEAFKGAGVEYPSGLPKLKFQIDNRANGAVFLKITSLQSINEPFVSLLVELGWSSGKLLREYTFLLDPPEFKAESPAVAEVKPVEPSLAMSSKVLPVKTESVEVVKNDPLPLRATAPVDKKVFASTEQKIAKPAPDSSTSGGTIQVKRGDTLSKLAGQVKSEVSLERMLVALYHANADAFEGNNLNRLKVGKILRLPNQVELNKVAQLDAIKELHAQVADWHVYRQSLAAAGGVAVEGQAKQEVSGKISTAIADKAPVAKEAAKEVVKLSKGEMPSDKATGNGVAATVAQANAKQDEAIAKDKAQQELRQRAAALEKNVKDMQHLAELKAQAAAVSVVPVQPVVTQPAAAVKTMPKPTQPANAKMVLTPPPSVLGDIVAYGFGGALGIVGLGWLLNFGLSRRKGMQNESGSAETTGSTSRMTIPVPPSPETGDFTSTVVLTNHAPQMDQDVDPISEADLFLNFGRDVQAEEILKDALVKNPNNHQIHLKLLSIYANRKDVQTFAVLAQQLKNTGDSTAWNQAALMGQRIDASNALYAGHVLGEDAPASMHQEVSTSLDFDLDVTASSGHESTVVLNAPVAQVMDFNLDANADGDFPNTVILKVPVISPSSTSQFAALDLDLDSTADIAIKSDVPQMGSIEPPNLDALIFDVTGSHQPKEQSSPVKEMFKAGDTMDFSLDFDAATPVVAQESTLIPEPNFAGIALDLTEDAPLALLEVSAEKWQESATKLDLAKAYQEMGDAEGAREILDEVMREGDEKQRVAAQEMLQKLSA